MEHVGGVRCANLIKVGRREGDRGGSLSVEGHVLCYNVDGEVFRGEWFGGKGCEKTRVCRGI